MDLRSQRGVAASGLVVGVALIVLVAAVSFVLLTKRAGEDAAASNAAALDAAAMADDRQAQSAARNALVAAKTAFTDLGSYKDVTPEMLGQIEPDLAYSTEPSTGTTQVSVAVTEPSVGIAVRSASGTCWLLRDDVASSTTTYGSGETCSGEAALATATLASW